MKRVMFSLAAGLGLVFATFASIASTAPENCSLPGRGAACSRCGSHGCQNKVCMVTCVVEELPTVVWNVEYKDYCIPTPRLCGAGVGIDAAGTQCPCQPPPRCGPVHTGKLLVRKEVMRQVPTYKCVPVCCGHCPHDCGPQMSGASLPQVQSDRPTTIPPELMRLPPPSSPMPAR